MESRFGRGCKFLDGAKGIVCIIPLTFTPMNCNGWAADMMQASGGGCNGQRLRSTQLVGAGVVGFGVFVLLEALLPERTRPPPALCSFAFS